MSDYVDSVFDNLAPTSEGSPEPSREAVVEALSEMRIQEANQVFADQVGQSPAPSATGAKQEFVTPEIQPQLDQAAANAAYREQGLQQEQYGPGPQFAESGTTLPELEGVEKFIEERFGIPLRDLIDNTIGGNQKTPEQIALEVREQSARQKEQNANLEQQMKESPVAEPLNIIAGSFRGAAENIVEGASLLSDTLATSDRGFYNELFPSLVPEYDEKKDPFSNEYEAFNADFGADRMAQTGWGKVVQGFGEFGATMLLTGGFGGIGYAQTTARGFVPDFLQNPEDGNLSNLIRDHAPDWYPDWLTALAVDDGENPWLSRLKSGLEGAGLNVAGEAAQAFVKGRIAARKAKAAGKSAKEAQEAGEAAARESLSSGVVDPTKPANVQNLGPADYFVKLRETIASNPEQYWTVDSIPLDKIGRGTVVSVDGGAGFVDEFGDIKGVFKDPASTRRGVADDILREAIKAGGDRLDNFDGYLTRIYERNGFRTFGRMKFNEEFAPKGWNKELHGTPDVVAMVYDPDGTILRNLQQSGTDLPKEGITFTDYDEMIAFRDAAISEAPSLKPIMEQMARNPEDGRAFRPIQLNNGTQVNFAFFKETDRQSLQFLPSNVREFIDVTWDATGEIGTEGRRIFSEFQRMAREELPPGTVLSNTPAGDSYGRGRSAAQQRRLDSGEMESIRSRLYERAGFGPEVDGTQYAVVRATPDARGRWLQPVDVDRRGEFARVVDAQRQMGRLRRPSVDYDTIAREHAELFGKGDNVADPDAIYQSFETGANGQVYSLQGQLLEDGTAVRIDPRTTFREGDELDEWLDAHADVLTREDAAIRIVEKGERMEIVRVLPHGQAMDIGKKFDVDFVTDLKTGERVDLGGADEILDTAGSTLNSYSNRPDNSVPPGQGRVIDIADESVDGAPTRGRINSVAQAANGQYTARASGSPVRGNGTSVLSDAARFLTGQDDTAARRVIDEAAQELDREMQSLGGWGTGKTWAGIRDDAAAFLDGWNGNIDAIPREVTSEGNEFLKPEYIVAVKTAMLDVSTRMAEDAYNVVNNSANYLDVTESFTRMADDLKALMRLHKASAEHYGLGLGSMRIPALGIEIPASAISNGGTADAMEGTIKMIDEVMDGMVAAMKSGDPKAVREAAKTANFIMMAGGDVSKIKSVGHYARQILADDALALMYNSMLSGPPTHVVNTVSNLFNTFYRPVAAATGGDAVARKMAGASFHNLHESISEAWSVGTRAFMTGNAVNDGGKGMVKQAATGKQLEALIKSAELSGNAAAVATARLQKMFHDFVNFPLMDLPSRFLTGSDEFFKTMVARMEFNARTMEAAVKSGENVQDTFLKLLDERKAATFDPTTGAILDEDLLKVGKEVTYQTSFQSGDGYIGAAKWFSDGATKLPGFQLFFPFLKTGHNIMVFTAQHMPGFNRLTSEYRAVMNGSDEYAKAIMRGREAYGYMTIASAGALYSAGMITGNGPADPEERKVWLKNNRPRSIRVGNKWVDYSRIEPFGMILSTVTDVADAVMGNKMSMRDGSYIMGQISYIIGMNMTQKTFFQGITPLSNLMQPGRLSADGAAATLLGMANNFIPFAGARRAYTNMISPYMQEVDSQVNRLLHAASGGALGDSAVKYDWLTGEPLMANSGGLNALSPIKVHDRNVDPVKDRLEDMGFEFNDVFKEVGDVKLTAEQRSQIQRLMGQSDLRKELEKLLGGPGVDAKIEQYQQTVRDGRIEKQDTPLYREISKLVRKYKKYAIDYLKRIDPEFQRQVDEIQFNKDQIKQDNFQNLLQLYKQF